LNRFRDALITKISLKMEMEQPKNAKAKVSPAAVGTLREIKRASAMDLITSESEQ
jgi:hypothetical protein